MQPGCGAVSFGETRVAATSWSGGDVGQCHLMVPPGPSSLGEMGVTATSWSGGGRGAVSPYGPTWPLGSVSWGNGGHWHRTVQPRRGSVSLGEMRVTATSWSSGDVGRYHIAVQPGHGAVSHREMGVTASSWSNGDVGHCPIRKQGSLPSRGPLQTWVTVPWLMWENEDCCHLVVQRGHGQCLQADMGEWGSLPPHGPSWTWSLSLG